MESLRDTDLFFLDIKRSDGTLFLTAHGELDMLGAERMRAALDRSKLRDLSAVRLDCRDVSFIDSVGVKSLLHLASRCEEARVLLESQLSANVDRVLGVLGVRDALKPSEEDAQA